MTTQRTLALLGLAALLAGAPLPALAEPASPASATDRARAHFQRAVDLYTERNYAAALVEFRRANAAAPNYRLLFNIGQTCHELSDYVCAIESYQEYLAKGGTEVAETRVAEVTDSIKKLKTRVATLLITANVEGAEIQVDDHPAGTTPLQKPMLVSAGRRKITGSKQGLTPVLKVLDLAGGDAVTVPLAFEVSPPRVDTPPPPPPAAGLPMGIWVGVGVTGALTAGAIITGILAARGHGDYERLLDSYPVKKSAIDDAAGRTQRLSVTSDVMLGSAVVAGAVTLIVGLTRKEPSRAPVSVAVGPASLAIHGRF